jgi:uncharacterized protein (TIGR02001 family)
MRNLRILAGIGLLVTAAAANAEVSGTAAIVSDYDYRGFTQTNNDATVQLSIDYAHESGWYVGAWGSGVDFGDPKPSTEVDVYTGYSGSMGDLGYDVGVTYYAYPGASDLNFGELYGKVSYSIVSGGVYFSNDFGGSDDSGIYVYGDVEIPAGPLAVTLHAGMSDGDGIGATYFTDDDGFVVEDSYTDYAIGLSYSASNFTIGMKWVALDAGDAGSDDRVVLSISTALPWGE